MYLQKLEIQGFKSFAHKTAFEFDQGITAIVGPNGSGKSNIADAVRWTLGEQSLKLLRGKKSQDVIFSGSGKKARLGMAEVSIFINNKDGQAPIDYAELIITRRIYQNGEGEYFINHKRVRLQDILLLLAKANFGQKSYSVIGQGMIDSVITASPQERKDFFDEAVGVKQYQIKREQANLKLIHTQENLNQAEILIQEIEPRLRSLTRQARRLERREGMEKGLKAIQQTHYFLLWTELNKQHNIQNKNYQEQTQKLKRIESEKEEIQKEINKIAQEDSRPQLFQKYQKDYQSLQEEKNKLLQEQVVLKGKTELVHIQEGRSDLAWLEKKKSELKEAESRRQKEIEDFHLKLKRETDLLGQYLKEQKEVVERFSLLEEKLTRGFRRLQKKPELDLPLLREAIERIYQAQKDFWERLEKAKKIEDISFLKKEANYIFKQLEVVRTQVKNIHSDQDSSELAKLQKELTLLLKTKDNLVNEINERKFQTQSLKEKMSFLQKEQNNTKEEIKKIETELNLVATISKGPEAAKKIYKEEEESIKKKIQLVEQKLNAVQEKLDSFNKEEQAKKDELLKWQHQIQEKQQQLNEITNLKNETDIEIAKLETKKEDLEKEIHDSLGLEGMQAIKNNKILLDVEFKNIAPFERIEKIQKLKHQLELIGGIDPAIQEEYQNTSQRYNFLKSQISDLREASHSLEKVIEELDEKIKKQFREAFNKINHEFGKYFRLLFGGGKASLTLKKEEIVSPQEELEEEGEQLEEITEKEEVSKSKFIKKERAISGIEILACPPGKKLSDLNMLSGGEKALSSISLICAIIANNPPPFIILDEVDAALDEANSIRFVKILEDLAHKTQFVTITHNRVTIQQAVILYGITMSDDGISKLLSVKMEDVDKIRNGK